jgi:hypothetical protein
VSLPLKDLGKAKITAETDAWLTVRARRTGRSKLDLMRDALHELAIRELHDAKLLVALAEVEGIAGDRRGQDGETAGTSGNSRELRGGRR